MCICNEGGPLDLTLEQMQFHVFLSNSKGELMAVLQDPVSLPQHPKVQEVTCSSIFQSASFLTECHFDITFYGESEYGWIPGFDRFFTSPADTFIALHVPADAALTDRALFTFSVKTIDRRERSFTLLLLGLFAYSFSTVLSRSVKLYLLFWTLAGAFVGLLSIMAFIVYFGSRTVSRGVGITNLLLMTTAGWASMYYVNLIPTGYDILQNK